MSTLYEEIKAAGIPVASHESDLYFPVTEQSRAILAKYPLQKTNATTFTNEAPPNIGERWFDVPFAYDPYWQARSPHAYQPKTGQKCSCKPGVQRDNCPTCEGTGWVIDFKAIRNRNSSEKGTK